MALPRDDMLSSSLLPFDVSRSKSLVDDENDDNDEITLTPPPLTKTKTKRSSLRIKVAPMPRIEKRNHLLSGWAARQTTSMVENRLSGDYNNEYKTYLSITARAALGDQSRDNVGDDSMTVDNHCTTVTTNNKSFHHSTTATTSPRTVTTRRQTIISSNSTSCIHNPNAISITPLHQIPYVHGGYASAAPLFVHDGRFMAILERLLPSAHDELWCLLWRNGSSSNVTTITKQQRPVAVTTAATTVATDNNDEFVITEEKSNHGSTISMTADPVKIMKWAENNPVVSAFGIWNSDAGRRRTSDFSKNIRLQQQRRRRQRHGDEENDTDDDHENDESEINVTGSTTIGYDQDHRYHSLISSSALPKRQKYPLPVPAMPICTSNTSSSILPRYDKPALEWDLFLDPCLVKRVDSALGTVDELELNLRKARMKRQSRKRVVAASTEEDNEDDFDLSQCHTAAQIEVDRLISQLLRRTIIAHGSLSHLVLEALGVMPNYNFGNVIKSSRDIIAVGVNGGQSRSSVGPSTPSRNIRRPSSPMSNTSLSAPCNVDEEERRDFESLLYPVPIVGNGKSTVDNPGRSVYHSSSSGRSKGMLLENWLHIFAQTLSLLSVEKMILRRYSSNCHTDTLNETRDNNNLHPSTFHNDDDSEYLTNDDMLSPTTLSTSSVFGCCDLSLCFGSDNPERGTHKSTFPRNPHASHKMAQDIERISALLGEPLRLVLDLKSRRVPPRVWSALIDSLRTRGLIIDGVGSFDMDESRLIGKGCSCPLNPILFFHSVGDLQRACHANEVKRGDIAYFNGGSLMWKRSSIIEAAGCCGGSNANINSTNVATEDHKSPKDAGAYSFQPYAYPRSALSDWERVMCKSTLEDYRRHFNLKIGVYVQEFSISPEALDALSIFVNKHGDIYDQGLAFGGVNGAAVKNVHGDGYWNQRYMGRSWDFEARPSKEMTPLKPEDHHLIQKEWGAWGQLGTIYEVTNEMAGALTVAPPQSVEPCNVVNDWSDF